MDLFKVQLFFSSWVLTSSYSMFVFDMHMVTKQQPHTCFLLCLLISIAALSLPLLCSEVDNHPWRWWEALISMSIFSYCEKKIPVRHTSIQCNFLKCYTFVWKKWQIKAEYKMQFLLSRGRLSGPHCRMWAFTWDLQAIHFERRHICRWTVAQITALMLQFYVKDWTLFFFLLSMQENHKHFRDFHKYFGAMIIHWLRHWI